MSAVLAETASLGSEGGSPGGPNGAAGAAARAGAEAAAPTRVNTGRGEPAGFRLVLPAPASY